MSTFTDELRHENYKIIQILAKSKRFGMRTLQGRRILFDNLGLIFNHMKKEDAKIHETLKKSANYHPALKQSLEMFKGEMERSSKYVKYFSLKHNANNATKELCDDFELLFKVITHRIEKEENIFYVEYDAIEKEEELLNKMLL